MFQALLCPSSGAHNYGADYHMGRLVLGWTLGAGRLDKCPGCRLWPAVRTAHVVMSTIVVSS